MCLLGMLLFAITGITLNHAGQIEAKPRVSTRTAVLPDALLQQLVVIEKGMASAPKGAARSGTKAPMPLTEDVARWVQTEFGARVMDGNVEWSPGEVYVGLPRPGGDAFLTIDLASGEVNHERTDRGVIAYLNDLHKGRNTGAVWVWFLDVFAIATLVFCITGFFLLQMHSRNRAATWPMVGLGLALPLVLAILFIH